jgi:virulence-associated protein VapD
MARKELVCAKKTSCVLQLDWYNNCVKSVAMIRLVETDNPSACVTANCKVCRSMIAL